MVEKVLDIQGIKKSFVQRFQTGRRLQAVGYRNVLDGLDLTLESGAVTALIGGNGAGKTTLFNIVSGLLRADEGKVVFNSRKKRLECTSAHPWVIAGAGLGRLFQGAKIFSGCTVKEHILLHTAQRAQEWPFSNLWNGKKIREIREHQWSLILDKLGKYDGFKEILAQPGRVADSLSFAQQRLIVMAALIAGEYELLMLDELSSGMSPELFPVFREIFNTLQNEGRSLFLIEHNMAFVKDVANMSYYVEEGRIKYAGPPGEVLARDEVKRSYLL